MVPGDTGIYHSNERISLGISVTPADVQAPSDLEDDAVQSFLLNQLQQHVADDRHVTRGQFVALVDHARHDGRTRGLVPLHVAHPLAIDVVLAREDGRLGLRVLSDLQPHGRNVRELGPEALGQVVASVVPRRDVAQRLAEKLLALLGFSAHAVVLLTRASA